MKPYGFTLQVYIDPSHQPANQDDEDQEGQDELQVWLDPAGHLQAAAFIHFRNIIVKSPAVFCHAEQKVHQGAAGEKDIADQEIFAVQYIPVSNEMDAGEYIVPQDTGDGKDEYGSQVDEYRFFTAPAEVIHGTGDEVFKDRRHRGQRSEGHEDEEQGAPEPAGSHVGENFRQGNKDKGRSLVRMHVVGKAGRENNESG